MGPIVALQLQKRLVCREQQMMQGSVVVDMGIVEEQPLLGSQFGVEAKD